MQTPRVRNGQVSLVFYDYTAKLKRCDKQSAWASQLFKQALESNAKLPLRCCDSNDGLCAADAFATADEAGIGGWWVPKGAEVKAENACWFSMCFSCRDLPEWFKAPESKSLQACIAAF